MNISSTLLSLRCPYCGHELVVKARLPLDIMPDTMLRVFLRYSIATCPYCGLAVPLE